MGKSYLVVVPAVGPAIHRASADALLYRVTDEPLLRYLGVRPHPTDLLAQGPHFPATDVRAELERVLQDPRATDRNRLAVLVNTTTTALTQTVTPVLWAMYGLLPTGAVRVALTDTSRSRSDLVAECRPGCYSLVGRSIDDRGEIVDPVRVDWEPHGAFVTPPGLWHAHHNESGAPTIIVPIQDAGLHTHLRSLDIRFAPPRR